MSRTPTDKPRRNGPADAQDPLSRRRAEALRANLRRRKDQARAREAGAADASGSGTDEARPEPDKGPADTTGNGD